jgi:selenoprotein W-related protein
VSLVDELLKDYEHVIESVALIPSDGGRFEISVNGELVFSKLQSKRHEAGELVISFKKLWSAKFYLHANLALQKDENTGKKGIFRARAQQAASWQLFGAMKIMLQCRTIRCVTVWMFMR